MSDVTVGSLGSSSVAQNASGVFDLHDEKSTVSLLRAIHQSPISPDEKNELRNAIFEFRNSTTSEVTPEFTALFSAHGFSVGLEESTVPVKDIVPTAPEPTPTPTSIGFTGARPVPQFTPSSVVPTANPPVQKIAVVSVPSVPEIKTPTPTPAPLETAQTITPVEADEEKVITPEDSAPPSEGTPPASAESESEPAPGQSTPTPAPAVVPNERIKVIKKKVNELVGNPVNLIDTHNDIGREYMNALLDAMKKTNGGTQEEVASAMVRLENAFTSVTQTIGGVHLSDVVSPEKEAEVVSKNPSEETASDLKSAQGEIPTIPPVAQPATSVVKPEVRTADGYAAAKQEKEALPTTEASLMQPESKVPPVVPVPSVAEEIKTVPQAPPIPSPMPTPVAPTPIPVSDPIAEPLAQQTQPVMPPIPEVSVVEQATEVAPPAVPPIPTTITPQPQAAPEQAQGDPLTKGGIMSVAKEKQIQDLMTAKTQEAATTDQQQKAVEIASMDPLMTPEVTNGLQQLLSEWSLFKSSGIFGTGANGIEHPLFKKLAVLNMTAVVAGRYEGATPQIKRSITDYMNGWRYEEGIMQEQGELFEHYLRRVIKHIIDKSKK